MPTSRDTASGTIKKFDPENMGIAVGMLLLCALELEICLGVKYPPQLPANVVKKLLPGQGLRPISIIVRIRMAPNFGTIAYSFSIRIITTYLSLSSLPLW